MYRLGSQLFMLFALLMALSSRLAAQSVTVTPSRQCVTTGQSIQFFAQAPGLSGSSVTWFAGGAAGGNSKVGTISAAGLYTAPAVVPPQNPVTITAVSTVNAKVSGSTTVSIILRGPNITSVTPNPLSTGTMTVTIQGSGFLNGATVLDTYNTTSVGLSTVSVTPTSITASGYQGNTTSASFSVKNPGTAYSNSITVPVAGAPTNYALSVNNGAGSGSYTAGTVVTITANSPPAGQAFQSWGGANVQNAVAATTTLVMPASNTSVTANYAAAKYTLTVNGGSGGGTYAAGAVVTIAANAPSAGQAFQTWTGASVTNANAATTTITMPAANTAVTANFASAAYTLMVNGGSGSGSYTAGTVVTLTSYAPPSGQIFQSWTGANVQNALATTTTLIMPAANATVTANFGSSTYNLTVVTGSGTGSYNPGTVVTITANAPPAGQLFMGWTGASVTNPNSISTTLTMPAGNTTVTAVYTTPAGQVPYPVSSHPRIWVTPNDLTRLQSWASISNPIYTQGILPVLAQAITAYTTQFFPGGVPNPNYPDPGDVQGYSGLLSEQYGVVFAFNSLIDPNPAARILYAQYARNLLMVAMNQAALGHLANAPFRDPLFATYNRATGAGEQWPLIVDWIYNARDANGNAILTASDKATIRNVFLMWCNDCLNASTEGNDHPSPIGVMNDPQLLPNNLPYRFASNNYYLSHARQMTMMALSIDPSDDAPLDPTVPPAQLGNTLRSYILDANGAWLYQEYAMMQDGADVANDYGIAGGGAGFGLASGGLPPEGMLYGHSFGFVLGQLLALQTAGFNNPALSGPQIALINAPVWDRFVTGYLSSLTPTSQMIAGFNYLGSLYQYGSYGDLLHLWVTPDFMQVFSLLALLEQENGQNTHLGASRWFCTNVLPGGPSSLINRVTAPWSFTESVLYFLLMDPAAAPATDPRPSYANTFYDPAAGRIVAHTGWSANDTMFDYRASWNSIDHQLGDGGQFELFRKGEWLTKEMSNYDSNDLGLTTVYHNTLALQNWSSAGTPNLNWFEAGEWANGSQWELGLNAGDPTTLTSTGAGYVYATSNLTSLYNRPDIYSAPTSAMDITQATRSILWLNGDYIVVYDRATSLHAGLFKRFNLSLVNNPVINANVVTDTLADGQQLFVQTLLPRNASISASNMVSSLHTIADAEPTQFILTVEDPTLPQDARFLHVLQGADSGVTMASATYLQSSSGTAFDGAAFGSWAVFFPVSGSGGLVPTSFTVGAGLHTLVVTGLAANSSYGVNVQASGGGHVITLTPGGNGGSSDSAGLLSTSF